MMPIAAPPAPLPPVRGRTRGRGHKTPIPMRT
jgi:hypothetical protein